MELEIVADLQSVLINHREFQKPVRLEDFGDVLGSPSRTLSGDPPVGHRNNQIHFFDDLGIYLIEHHATYLIEGIQVVLAPDTAPFVPLRAFSGRLIVGNVEMKRGMRVEDVPADSSINFRLHLGYSLYADGEYLSIDMPTYSLKTQSGRRSKIRYFSYVSIGFQNAHRIAGSGSKP